MVRPRAGPEVSRSGRSTLSDVRTISKRTKYALRALYALTRAYGQEALQVPKLSEAEQIPAQFLHVILLQLKDRGLLESRKGKHGGYLLAKPPDQVTIGAVIRILEGPLAPLPCASETAYQPCEECADVHTCITRLTMKRVRDATADILDHTTLADVVQESDALRDAPSEAEALMYYI